MNIELFLSILCFLWVNQNAGMEPTQTKDNSQQSISFTFKIEQAGNIKAFFRINGQDKGFAKIQSAFPFKNAYLEELYLMKEARTEHYGTEFLDFILNKLKEAKFERVDLKVGILLDADATVQGQKRLLNFYKKFGFVETNADDMVLFLNNYSRNINYRPRLEILSVPAFLNKL